MKTLNKILGASAAVLAVLLGLQLLILSQQEPREVAYATWADNPKSLAEGQDLANQIVRGRVIKVERGKDLVVKAPGEPGGEDRIPVEIVTLGLTGGFKGQTPQSVRVFHTGISRLSTKGIRQKPKPSDGKHGGEPIPAERPSKQSASQVNRFTLDDDPPYKVGQDYIMYLRDGPTVGHKIDGKVKTLRIVNPTLRVQVVRGKELRPAATRMNFAKQLHGKPVTALTRKLPKFKPIPFSKQALQVQRIRLDELKKGNQMQEYNRLLRQLPQQRRQQLQLQ